MSNEGIRTKLTIVTKNSCNKWKVMYNNKKGDICYGEKDKLIKRLKSRPKDFTFDEAETLLKYFDFDYSNKGKTSGSRVIFESENHGCIMLHKPHPQKELKAYQIKQLIEYLEQEDLI